MLTPSERNTENSHWPYVRHSVAAANDSSLPIGKPTTTSTSMGHPATLRNFAQGYRRRLVPYLPLNGSMDSSAGFKCAKKELNKVKLRPSLRDGAASKSTTESSLPRTCFFKASGPQAH